MLDTNNDSMDIGDDDDDDDEHGVTTDDVTKMTERQRSKILNYTTEESDTPSSSVTHINGKRKRGAKELLSLMDNGYKKKEFTAEEIQLRKLEAARKRKNFNARKLEKEKKETINKLLMKRADKVRNLNNLKGKEYDDDDNADSRDEKRRVLIQHEALFSWSSKSVVRDSKQQCLSTYSFNPF
ncbi:unnamed protein product [Ambrosiozyma monospora]|uniref:Unnamed protein product n=1 Tax=Ambrosiozyma monospora TaxID=43982 RepID=A0A9W7DHS8_AMBMO|nr:unnamed protein product [Ambrosiozyma monospora]